MRLRSSGEITWRKSQKLHQPSLNSRGILWGDVMSLFKQGKFKLHSGALSSFRIECDWLAPEDWIAIAKLISEHFDFKEVVGIPSGGLKLADALKFYKKDKQSLPTLLVDDVLTTGTSMEKIRQQTEGRVIGVVLFARDKCPSWIIPVFEMKMRPIERRKLQ